MPAALLLGWQQSSRLKRALQRSQAALRATREQLGALINRAPVGIVQADLNGRILLANRCYCSLVGHCPQHLRTLALHDLTHPDDRTAHLEQQAEMLATGRPFQIEKRLVRADESDVWVISHMDVTHDADGRPMHVIAAVQDISHRRAAEAAMQVMTASLEQQVADEVAERIAAQEKLWQRQRMEALGQLAGGVAHDFNNVLQAIAGGARLIQRRPDNAAAVERLAGLVVDAAERGAVVTQRLLSFARRGRLQPGPIEVAVVLTEICDVLGGTLGGDINVELAISETLPQLLADRGQLEAVLVNLATNARDAMMGIGSIGQARNAGHVLRLSASTTDGAAAGLRPAPYVRIDISDSGPGMDLETLEHAMEPFFTTKPRGRGTGLGLAMARGFAEQSGGKLLLHSVAGQGATASLYLPQAFKPAGQAASRPGANLAKKPRIVLVDDDPEILEVLGEVLTSCGYGVENFDGAAVALEHLGNEAAIDLLITDLSMPGTDGLALIREAQRRQPGLPAILLTGYSADELGLTTGRLSGGHLMLLQKPVRTIELTKQVAAMLSAEVAPPV
jgi:PAS domain S-box-containing protein